jgi:acetyl-CoA acetyltransferase
MNRPTRFARDVAIVGIGVAGLARDSGKSLGALALSACADAIKDAGLRKDQIDGVSGVYGTDHASVCPGYVVNGLGLKNIGWSGSAGAPSMATLMDGIAAIGSGMCDYALTYHAKYRWDVTSNAARNDPLRQSPPMISDPMLNSPLWAYLPGTNAVAASMRRHMHDYGSTREHFGMIVVNGRANAQRNPRAIYYGQPLTIDQYLASPFVHDPFCLFDMDMPIDAASAVIITTAERARDLRHRPVIVEDFTCGVMADCDLTFQPWGIYPGARYIMDTLWRRTGLCPNDVDLASLYDGYSPLCMDWIEAAFCDRGEGAGLLEDAFNTETGELKLLGRIPVNTHGGNLSEGRLQGMGQVLEAVTQLRGEAAGRQISNARCALVTNAGGPISSGMILQSS